MVYALLPTALQAKTPIIAEQDSIETERVAHQLKIHGYPLETITADANKLDLFIERPLIIAPKDLSALVRPLHYTEKINDETKWNVDLSRKRLRIGAKRIGPVSFKGQVRIRELNKYSFKAQLDLIKTYDMIKAGENPTMIIAKEVQRAIKQGIRESIKSTRELPSTLKTNYHSGIVEIKNQLSTINETELES